jgi:hypothetical protein
MADSNESIADEYILSLQRRVESLEQKLVGEEKVREGQPPLLRLLKTIDKKLSVVGEPIDQVTRAWGKVPELEMALDRDYINNIKLNQSAKEELLFWYADQIEKYQHDIEELQYLKDVIDSSSPAFQELHGKDKALSQIASTHIQQEHQVDQLTTGTRQLVDVYTKFLIQTSSQCVKWDELTTTKN